MKRFSLVVSQNGTLYILNHPPPFLFLVISQLHKLRKQKYYVSMYSTSKMYAAVRKSLLFISLWNIRLFTVPYFFVRSFRYTASYRHGYLDFQMFRGDGRWGIAQGGGGGGEKNIFLASSQTAPARPLSSFDPHARWQPVTLTKRPIWTILRKNRGL